MNDRKRDKNEQMKIIEIKIKNINCSGCKGRIYRALSQYDGIVNSSVDMKTVMYQ